MTLTVGSLCTGTGQLERALTLAGADTELAFVADPDPAASLLLAHHYPTVPNLGDITAVRWTSWGPQSAVDWDAFAECTVVCAGWPCQPWSLAGLQKGADDERAIWPAVAYAIRRLRPRYVFLENVPGAVSAGELARALADLASLGYVGSWRCVRASDVGAAHKRERLFILAWQAGDSPAGLGLAAAGPAGCGGDGAVLSALLPTPRTSDTNGAGSHGDGGMDLRTAVTLLPTPMAADGGANRGSSAGHGLRNTSREIAQDWGPFGPAIERWEAVMGRPAPKPTEEGKNGKRRLSPRFAEWLMGHLDGFVCDVPSLSRAQQLKLCGNGVVALQGAHALRLLTAS